MQTTKIRIHSLSVHIRLSIIDSVRFCHFGMGNDWHRKSCHSETRIFIRNKDEEEKNVPEMKSDMKRAGERKRKEQNFGKSCTKLVEKHCTDSHDFAGFLCDDGSGSSEEYFASEWYSKKRFFCIVFSIIVTNHFAWKYSFFFSSTFSIDFISFAYMYGWCGCDDDDENDNNDNDNVLSQSYYFIALWIWHYWIL